MSGCVDLLFTPPEGVLNFVVYTTGENFVSGVYTTGQKILSSGVELIIYTTGGDLEFCGVTLILYTTRGDLDFLSCDWLVG